MDQDRWRRVEELYHCALERAPESRTAFLEERCSDLDLRREVESLLAQSRDGLLDHPAAELIAGGRLGPYEILGLLGQGGMGTVYKARDTRVDRTVAIKVSAAQFSGRFEREARAVAALNHPHICALYDVGPNYLVMEYVDGKPLRGPLPVNEALRLAVQLLGALDAAHRKGIVHRDLKPANILVAKSGIKVLDFGLAKMESAVAAIDEAVTQKGAILGTLHYMSPEQVQGKETDARSDIFSFGLVLYEMLTGRRAFEAENPASVVAAILEREPPLLEGMIAPELGWILQRCLAKDPEERWQSARDLQSALERAGHALPDHPAEAAGRRRWLWPAVAAALLLAVSALLIGNWRSRPGASPAVRLTMELAPAERLTDEFFRRPIQTAMAFSPDGNTLVFAGSRGSGAEAKRQLYRRALDRQDAVAIPGTEGAVGPFFSPDGKWVGYWANQELRRVPADGGPAVSICGVVGQPWDVSWGPGGAIFFADYDGVLRRVSANGGAAQTLLEPDRARRERFASPELLPDGKVLLYTARTSLDWTEAQIVARRLDTGQQRVLLKGGTQAHYVPTGHLLYMLNGVLMGVPFDLNRTELAGAPVPLIDGVMQSVNAVNVFAESGMGQFAVSRSGRLAYASGGIYPARGTSVVRVDRKGVVTDLNLPKGRDWMPRLSPDGQRIAVTRHAETSRLADIWTYDLVRGAVMRLTTQGGSGDPIWSPDGKRILFGESNDGKQIFSILADGQGGIETVLTGKSWPFPGSISPDGKWLAYLDSRRIWLRPMSGGGSPNLFVESQYELEGPEFSPDGKWIAYSAKESPDQVYVQAFPGPGEKHRISAGQGTNPAWAPNGRELFYAVWRRNHLDMMAVEIAPGNTFHASAPRTLFEGENDLAPVTAPMRNYDVYPDGQHFIMLRNDPLPDMRVTSLTVVLNWFEELKRRAPRGGQ